MNVRPAIALTASSMLAAVACLAPLSTSAQTTTAQSTTTVPGAVMSTSGNTTTVTATGTNTTGTTTTGTTTTGATGAGTTATSTTPGTTTGVTGAVTGAREAFLLTCIFDVRTTPVSFIVFEASGLGTPGIPGAPPLVTAGMPCSQALGALLSSGFALAASLPAFDGATQYTLVR
jgi:hypothetical protein